MALSHSIHLRRRLFFLLCLTITASHPLQAASEDIREQRYFQPKSSLSQSTSLLRRGFEGLFIPLRTFSNFAERVDLPNRIRDFFYNDDYTAGIFPAFSFGGELGGTALGVNAFHSNLWHEKKKANVGFLFKDVDSLTAKAGYEDPSIGGSDYHWQLKTDYLRDDQVEIFARDLPTGPDLGMDTRSEDETSFSLTRFNGRLEAGKRIDHVDLGIYARGLRGHATKKDTSPTLESFAGFDDVVSMGGGGFQALWEGRRNPARPTAGTWIQASGGVMAGPDRFGNGKRAGYSEYHLDLRHHILLFEPGRTLALRSALDRLDPLSGSDIPFYELPISDKNHGARNLSRGRFRDKGALTFNAEYRYPIWVTWDAFIFMDAAQTFPDYDAVTLPRFRYSEGFGIRFGGKDKTLFNLQIGLGREKPEIGLAFTQVF